MLHKKHILIVLLCLVTVAFAVNLDSRAKRQSAGGLPLAGDSSVTLSDRMTVAGLYGGLGAAEPTPPSTGGGRYGGGGGRYDNNDGYRGRYNHWYLQWEFIN